jgi:hypothetical protein
VTPPDAPPWGDQVVRLETFLAAHPNFEVMTSLDTRSVWWKAICSGEVYAVENDYGGCSTRWNASSLVPSWNTRPALGGGISPGRPEASVCSSASARLSVSPGT